MKKFLIYIACVGLPFFLLVPTVNYCIDPAHTIDGEEYADKIVTGLKQGYNVTNLSDHDERFYKKKLAELYKDKELDFLILGSSRSMLLNRHNFNSDKVLNLSVSGATVKDFLAFYEICKQNNIKYKKLIIGMDPVMVSCNDLRWKSIGEYYYSAIGQTQQAPSVISLKQEKLDNLFSVGYFKTALKHPKQLKLEYIKSECGEEKTTHLDGSLCYDRKYRNSDVINVNNTAKIQWHHSYDFECIDTILIKEFELLLSDCLRNKIDITFFFSPYHKYLYDRLFILAHVQAGEKEVYRLANEYHIHTIGNYNPDYCNVSNEDFYDGMHARQETIDKLMQKDFSKN